MAKTCRSCGLVMPDTADRCECGHELHRRPDFEVSAERLLFSRASYWLALVALAGGLLFLFWINVQEKSAEQAAHHTESTTGMGSRTLTYPERSYAPSSSQPARRSVSVTSQIVKQIDGKHRYFFSIRNHGTTPFVGAVRITLLGDAGPLGRETFSTRSSIAPGLGTTVYLDINTGPVAVHGDYGIKQFQFEASENGQVVASGTGEITDRLERF